jgi:hypothetical protein
MGKEIHPQGSHQIRKRPSESGTDLKVSKQKHGNLKNVFKAYLLRIILLHQMYFFLIERFVFYS